MTNSVEATGAATQIRSHPLRGKVSLCRACGKVFTTTSTFDKHRVGKFDIAAPGYGRRCLTDAEMDDAGWGTNQYGRWFRAWMGPARAYVIRHATISGEPLPRYGEGETAP